MQHLIYGLHHRDMRVSRALNREPSGRIPGISCACITSGDARDSRDFTASTRKTSVEVHHRLWIVDHVGDNSCETFGV
jgi:hypothetical protein